MDNPINLEPQLSPEQLRLCQGWSHLEDDGRAETFPGFRLFRKKKTPKKLKSPGSEKGYSLGIQSPSENGNGT